MSNSQNEPKPCTFVPDIRQDSFVAGMLKRLPGQFRDSFSDEQLLALKIALGARKWGVHPLDLRASFGFWRWRYYYVIIAGVNKRTLTRQERELAAATTATLIFLFLTVSTLLGLLVLYLAKSALGIDILPGVSLGIWDWFKAS